MSAFYEACDRTIADKRDIGFNCFSAESRFEAKDRCSADKHHCADNKYKPLPQSNQNPATTREAA